MDRSASGLQEAFLAFVLASLRNGKPSPYGDRECDYYVHNLAHAWCLAHEGASPGADNSARVNQIVAVGIEVAWELVRRGILRPGGKRYPDSNASDPGRFTLTARGREWIKSADETHFIVMQGGPLARALDAFTPKFGAGYQQRSQEALKCRKADAWLATCAMCGAAAVSILLALAVAKAGYEDAVLKDYKTASGRKKTIDNLIGRRPDTLQRPFRSLMGILSYWRDDAAHGTASPISNAEAEEGMRQLLMLAQFAHCHWADLVAP